MINIINYLTKNIEILLNNPNFQPVFLFLLIIARNDVENACKYWNLCTINVRNPAITIPISVTRSDIPTLSPGILYVQISTRLKRVLQPWALNTFVKRSRVSYKEEIHAMQRSVHVWNAFEEYLVRGTDYLWMGKQVRASSQVERQDRD